MIQTSHSLSPASLHLFLSNHSLINFQFFLYRKQLLTLHLISHSPTSKLKNPLPTTPLSVTILKTSPIVLYLSSVFPLKTYSTMSQTPTSMVHQLTNPHHLPFHQKLAQHWFQNLNSHPPLPPKQQNKQACLTFFQRYQLRKPRQDGTRGSEIMKTETERSMKNKKEKMRQGDHTSRPIGVS